jgi:hypothetical protein
MPEEPETTPIFTRSEFRDIGHDVRVREVYADGKIHAVEYVHPCKEGFKRLEGDYIPLAPPYSWDTTGWTLVSEKPLTISPSLLCRTCGHHGFIEHDKWRAA